MRLLPTLMVGTLMLATPALADDVPPAGAMPLSEVIATVEAMDGVAMVIEVDWDDDGYWEIEYVDTDNRTHELDLDPMTAQSRG